MSEVAEEKPVWRTGSLWGVLAVLLVLGAVGSATFVYGLLALFAGSVLGGAVAAFGAVVAFLSMLFMIGVLYRVDRYRGALGRRIELFE
jgi:CBS domain containing-hemolysin-like protein